MKKIIIASLLTVSLAACSTTPKAEEVCTSNWIQKRSVKAVDNIFGETQSTVKTLRKVGSAYMEGKSPNVFQLFSLASKVKGLEKELLRGSGIRDLKTVARTCNNPAILTDGVSSYVDRLGLPDRMRSFMENMPDFQNMINYHLQDLRNPQTK